jgi:hypothetical protein
LLNGGNSLPEDLNGLKPAGSQSADLFLLRLNERGNRDHPLAQLATHIEWCVFEREWAEHSILAQPSPTSTSLIGGLLYLQHTLA